MRSKDYLLLFLTSLASLLIACFFQRAPGYMDADYYYANGIQLKQGNGLTENFLWNYLDDPSGLPHPAFTYWMPLPSLLAAGGMFILGSTHFNAARFPFFILASIFPLFVTYSYTKLFKTNKGALLAGLLTIFPGFYFLYLTITETFLPTMYLGLGFILVSFAADIISHKWQDWVVKFLTLGLITGLMHLTRADGIAWVLFAIAILVMDIIRKEKIENRGWKHFIVQLVGLSITVLVGYILVMFPWYERNLSVFHTLLPPGGSGTLWLMDYNQTFIYPSSQLNFQNWWGSGWQNIMSIRLDALASNLKTALAVQGMVFLAPLILVGLWDARKKPFVLFAVFYWVFLVFVMSMVFPFAGARGGFLHSASALQSIFWMAAPFGLQKFILWGVKKRGWIQHTAWNVFGMGMVVIAFFLSASLFFQRAIGEDFQQFLWQASQRDYLAVEAYITRLAGDEVPVMVNNPPGYVAANGRAAIVIPFADIETIHQVADRYQVSFLVVDENHVPSLIDFYLKPQDYPGFDYLASIDGMIIYKLDEYGD
jgi:hypothetical protein